MFVEVEPAETVGAGRRRTKRQPSRPTQPFSVAVVEAGDLDDELLGIWRSLRAGNSDLHSPFFCPEFTLAVSRVRLDVEVGVLQRDGAVIGFLPFQRGRRGQGRPVAFGLSDFHGLVAGHDEMIDVKAMLSGCGLRSFSFNHLPASQAQFDELATTHVSPFIDVSGGAAAWLAARRKAEPKRFDDLRRSKRRLSEVGDVRYERHVDDAAVLDTLLRWKSAQYRRTGVPDGFTIGWTVELLRDLHRTRTPGFGGQLSALWVGDELAAVHMGIANQETWHYWFPSYSERFAPRSPGLLLLLEMAMDAGSTGVGRIDLGTGTAHYKSQFGDGACTLLEGRAGDDGPVARRRRQLGSVASAGGDVLRRTPLAAPLRIPSRILRNYRKKHRLS